MTKRILIDATHAEETRVVLLDGNRLEDFDVETSTKKQLKGNIYLAKVVRVEPSLQAAFVEYGGGRHGFLAFGEIHPDYYQIPVADRQRLLRMQAEEARAEEEADDAAAERVTEPAPETVAETETEATAEMDAEAEADSPAAEPAQPQIIAREVKYGETSYGEVTHGALDLAEPAPVSEPHPATSAEPTEDAAPAEAEAGPSETDQTDPADAPLDTAAEDTDAAGDETETLTGELELPDPDQPPPEMLGGENDVFEGNGADEARARRSSRLLRNYRIQEVIKRRQILLIQVVKEERGTKGAALTTYISLAGRFCVLMPNSPRGGGISRKITSTADRRRLKEIITELEVPEGMGLIVRTAGAARPKPEIRRDCEYLMRLWDDIREHTLRSTAPALIYEEASLIKRTIRDVYSRDVDDVLVDGEEGWRAAHDFMRMLMPSHARKVQFWRSETHGGQPLFSAHGVEAQLDAMLTPNVQLRSGGYLVINQAEALVAIDVNSGRSTRERGIEETALRTNLEAADEVARQLRLRDLAGLIVIDFIDMESRKHNAMVERRLKDALKNDRARIQLGHISHFGLLEMSRQRLRSSLAETSFVTCPHCAGLGLVRSTESAAIHVLRAIEEEGGKGRAALIMVHVASGIVMYILNNKRDRLAEIEARTAMRVQFAADDSLLPPEIRIDRLRPQVPEAERLTAGPVAPTAPLLDVSEEDEDDLAMEATDADPASDAKSEEENEQRRRRRRRRRGGRRDGTEGRASDTGPDGETDEETAAEAISGEAVSDSGEATEANAAAPTDEEEADAASAEQPTLDPADLDENGMPKARRRGRRGGRRRRRDGTEQPAEAEAVSEEAAPAFFTYTGPTPANPFGGQTYDIFDIMDQAAEQPAPAPRVSAPVETLDIPPVPADAVAPAEMIAPAAEAPVVPAAEPAVAPAAEPAVAPEPEPTVISAAPVAEAEVAIPPAPVAETAPPAVMEPEAVPPPPPTQETAPPPVADVPAVETAAVAGAEAVPAVAAPVVETAPPAPPKRGWWRR